MSKYEAEQKWGNEHNEATITNVATSYDDTYIRYVIEGKQYEMNEHTFSISFPNAVVAPVVPGVTASVPTATVK